MSIGPFAVILLLFSFQVFASVDLDQTIDTLGLEPVVIKMLNLGEDQPVTVGRLISYEWWTLEHFKKLPRTMLSEIEGRVSEYGLALYLTEAEVETLARTGAVPEPSLISRTDRLPLGFGARLSLRRVGVRTIGDVGSATRKQLLSKSMPPRTITQIAAVVAPYGITIWADAREAAVGARGRLAPALEPLERLGFCTVLLNRLHSDNLWNVNELKDRDRVSDLRKIPMLGPLYLRMIAEALLERGHLVSWLHRVDALGLPADLVEQLKGCEVLTRNDLRLFFDAGERGELPRAAVTLMKEVGEHLKSADCAARLNGTLPAAELKVVDVDQAAQGQARKIKK